MLNLGLNVPEDSLRRIHEASVRILGEIGIRTDHAVITERLAARGCHVKGERVFFPPELVAATIQAIPASFPVYGRSVDNPLTIGLNETYGTNTGIFANIFDFDSGKPRRSTLQDVKTTTRLLDAMENVHVVYVSLVDATEKPPHLVTLSDFAAVLENTTKPLVGPGVTNRAEAEAVVAMALAIRHDNREALRNYPLCVPFVCPVSPLFFPKDIVDAMIVIAEAGLPLDSVTNPVMGLTSPFTLAGTVALGHAEMLALAVMAHTITPGLPILNQNTPSVADMRTLASTTGGPETGLIRQTAMLLSQYLNIPGCAHGHTSSARLDYQAGEEKALNSLLIAGARPALLGGLGSLANVTVASLETILLDNERFGAIFRILKGVQVDEEHLGFETISDQIGEDTFLASEHTLKYLRSDEVWKPILAVREGLVEGVPPLVTSLDRARASAKELVESYRVAPLPEEIRQEIDQIIEAYDHANVN